VWWGYYNVSRETVSGLEYGTNKLALMSMLVEAEELADVRLTVRDRLLADVIVQLKEWKTANYHKQMVGSCKEAKTFEDDFHKVCVTDFESKFTVNRSSTGNCSLSYWR